MTPSAHTNPRRGTRARSNTNTCARLDPSLGRSRRESAFTLIELMAVLAIIAVMAVVIIPEMRGTFDDALLRSTARKLIHACQAANSRAITLNQPQRLRVDPIGSRYYLESRPPGSEESTESTEPPATTTATTAGRIQPTVEGQLDRRITIEIAGGDRAGKASNPSSANSLSTGPTRSSDDSPDTGEAQVLSFFPDGTASGPAIVLRDREGFRLRLTLHPVTARLHLTELPGPRP
jgi:type II secretion system protein H